MHVLSRLAPACLHRRIFACKARAQCSKLGLHGAEDGSEHARMRCVRRLGRSIRVPAVTHRDAGLANAHPGTRRWRPLWRRRARVAAAAARAALLPASRSRPSTVVMQPRCVAAGISNSSSGMLAVALSDLTTCPNQTHVPLRWHKARWSFGCCMHAGPSALCHPRQHCWSAELLEISFCSNMLQGQREWYLAWYGHFLAIRRVMEGACLAAAHFHVPRRQ